MPIRAAPPGPTTTPSATGTAAPEIVRRDRSNGSASSVPLRVARTTWPEETYRGLLPSCVKRVSVPVASASAPSRSTPWERIWSSSALASGR